MNTLLFSSIALIAPIPASYLVEALRRQPLQPISPHWAPELTYEYVEVNGNKLRYLKTGSGPVIVLLHTLRTQLDMWQNVIPTLSKEFTVYAMDHLGHGFSDIPIVEYKPQLFMDTVAGFLDKLNIEDATIVGESIGATVGLMLAASQNHRVNKVIAVNPYDYDRGKGIYRSSFLAKLLFSISVLPILGATFWRLRSFPIFQNIMRGGVKDSNKLPKSLLKEMHQVGNRQGHYQAFMSLIKNFPAWEFVIGEYGNIKAPTLLLYGDSDWSNSRERTKVYNLIPNAVFKTLENTGHFASLDAADKVSHAAITFINQ